MIAVNGESALRPFVLPAIREVTGRHYLHIGSFSDHPPSARIALPAAEPRRHAVSSPLHG
jgi:hypothetical protein